MKKTIITMLIALVAMVAGAETYNYLKFTKTNGTTVTYSVEGLKLTYDNTNVTITNAEGTNTIALAEVQDMYFSNDPGSSVLLGDVNNDGAIDISDATALINYLLSGDATGLNLENANCDQAGGVDISDATALINYLLNGSW
ncbi:MAG: dockerin type I repeat-containing protein [Muribaculaceae bacterium]|nr:dockerin type I repeat-containing protein [Muribaculaceae bacterium]